jgi:hypothetical protein
MRKSLGWIVAPLALLGFASVASAGSIKYADGKAENLVKGQEYSGPGTVTGVEAKDTIELKAKAKIRFLGSTTDEKGHKAESYFLVQGACTANLGFFTRIATPAFWAFPEKEDAKSVLYVETFGVNTAYARTAAGSGMVRLVTSSDAWGIQEVQLSERQGVTVQRGSIKFTTDAHNEWNKGMVRVLYPLSTGLLIDLYVPKATSGYVKSDPNNPGKTLVKSDTTSWKSGAVRIVTSLGNTEVSADDLRPGVEATIDNQSGTIEIGVVNVEFSTLKAAVSLTSEFASLATSPIEKP